MIGLRLHSSEAPSDAQVLEEAEFIRLTSCAIGTSCVRTLTGDCAADRLGRLGCGLGSHLRGTLAQHVAAQGDQSGRRGEAIDGDVSSVLAAVIGEQEAGPCVPASVVSACFSRSSS